MSRDDKLTKNVLHRNSVHITIDEVIGIPETYIHRPIVGLYSNYNYNYNSGSSEGYSASRITTWRLGPRLHAAVC